MLVPMLASCAPPSSDSLASALYQRFDDCSQLVSWYRTALKERVENPYAITDKGMPAVDVAAPAAEAGQDGAGSGISDEGGSSTTTVQEQGIDEGDIAKNDGSMIYVAIGSELRVIPTEPPFVAERSPLPDGQHSMLVSAENGTGSVLVATSRWVANVPETVLSRFAVADGKLELIAREHLEGSLVSLRSLDGTAHLVLRHDPLVNLAFVHPGYTGTDDDARRANEEVIDALGVSDILPRRYVDGDMASMSSALDCTNVGTPGTFSGMSVTWVVSTDLGDPSADLRASAGVVAEPDIVYVGQSSLVAASTIYPDSSGKVVPVRTIGPESVVHRFDLTEAGAVYQASVMVPGRLLSSYAVSEHDGFLRVATTTEATGFGRDSMSGVHVLEHVGDELLEVGSVEGIGIGEQIQGVRFAGDLAYVVTFRRIDPLVIVDLSNPRQPKVRGELKVPGYSTWMQLLDDGRLLAFGYAGDDAGSITGVQWSLFDVSDLDAPKLIDTLPAGPASEAAHEPHAITVVAMPIYGADAALLLWPVDSGYFRGPVEPQVTEPTSLPDGGSTGSGSTGSSSPSSGADAPDGSLFTDTFAGGTLGSAPAIPYDGARYLLGVGSYDGLELVELAALELPARGLRTMMVAHHGVCIMEDGAVFIWDDGGYSGVVVP